MRRRNRRHMLIILCGRSRCMPQLRGVSLPTFQYFIKIRILITILCPFIYHVYPTKMFELRLSPTSIRRCCPFLFYSRLCFIPEYCFLKAHYTSSYRMTIDLVNGLRASSNSVSRQAGQTLPPDPPSKNNFGT